MAVVVAAAVARGTDDNSFGGAAVFEHVNVVERFGRATADGFVKVDTNGPLVDANTRVAIKDALAPATVTWVSSLTAVIGTGEDLPTYEDVGAVLTLAGSEVDGDQAMITTGL